MTETISFRQSKDLCPLPKTDGIPKNIAPVEKPSKAEAIQNLRTRFL